MCLGSFFFGFRRHVIERASCLLTQKRRAACGGTHKEEPEQGYALYKWEHYLRKVQKDTSKGRLHCLEGAQRRAKRFRERKQARKAAAEGVTAHHIAAEVKPSESVLVTYLEWALSACQGGIGNNEIERKLGSPALPWTLKR